MQLETVIKLVKSHKNCLGYVKADNLIKDIAESLKHYELIITVRRISDKSINTEEIINTIIMPICKAKQVQCRNNNSEIHIVTRRITTLHVLNNIFECVNRGLGKTEGFEILSNYELLREEIRSKEIN